MHRVEDVRVWDPSNRSVYRRDDIRIVRPKQSKFYSIEHVDNDDSLRNKYAIHMTDKLPFPAYYT